MIICTKFIADNAAEIQEKGSKPLFCDGEFKVWKIKYDS